MKKSSLPQFIGKSYNVLTFLVIVLAILSSCDSSRDYNGKIMNMRKPRIEFRAIDSQMIIYNVLDAIFPDSISTFTCKSIFIQSPNLFNYKILFSLIKPDKLEKINIRDYNHETTFSIDLKKFNRLKTLRVFGDTFLREIILKQNLSCKLKEAVFHSQSLLFPDFDSSLLEVDLLSYNGITLTLPEWLDSLKNIEKIYLEGSNIGSVECSLCKLPNLKYLFIADTPLYKLELKYKERYGRYKVLQKYVDCKPDLKFIQGIIPY